MKFLLVDDDLDDVNLFKEAVSDFVPRGECAIAENGEQVFEILAPDNLYKPDIIFLDINMPVMDGWECLGLLKKDPSLQTIPVIIYSTSAAMHDVRRAYEQGALAFVTKPESFKELTKILYVVAETPQQALFEKLRAFKNVKMNA